MIILFYVDPALTLFFYALTWVRSRWDEGRMNAAVYCDSYYNKQSTTIPITAYTAASTRSVSRCLVILTQSLK